MTSKYSVLLILIVALHNVSSARILVLHPSPSQSHLIVTKALTKELACRGHEVTMFSQFPLEKPLQNYRDIKVEINDTFSAIIKGLVSQSGSIWSWLKVFPKLVASLTETGEAILQHPELQRMMREEKFDLVIVGYFATNFLLGVADHFKCPQIMISPAGVFTSINMVVGNPYGVDAVPHIATKITGRMTFLQRVFSFFMYSLDVILMVPFDFHQNIIYRRYFPAVKYMSYDDAHRNVSLMLVNQHFSQANIRPFVPAMVEVGGLQIKAKPSPLPVHLQKWIDGAEHGVIYFSLGSNAKSNLLPKEKIDILLKTFAKFKQRVIFKWESNELPGKPDNVLTDKWLPQDDILANGKVKLFISHCGLGGVTESKYHGVPIICMAIFADQMTNAANIESEGWGLSSPLETLTEDGFTGAIKEVLENPKYKSTVQKLSNLFRDRPNSALETAVFWTEYVIRHRGAPHMHYPGADLNFFQRNSLDVIAALLLVLYVFGKIVAFLFRRIKAMTFCLFRLARRSPKQSLDKKKN